MQSLLADRVGGFYTNLIVVITLFVVDITYLAVALTTNKFFDMFVAGGYVSNVQMENLLGTLRFVGPIVIVVINAGLVVILIASAWKRGTNETEDLGL